MIKFDEREGGEERRREEKRSTFPTDRSPPSKNNSTPSPMKNAAKPSKKTPISIIAGT